VWAGKAIKEMPRAAATATRKVRFIMNVTFLSVRFRRSDF